MVRITDYLYMTIAVDWDIKSQTKHMLKAGAFSLVTEQN